MGNPLDSAKIESDKLILVEGDDDVKFLQALIEHERISGIQILPAGGKVPAKIPIVVKLSDFQRVKLFAAILDADRNAASTFQSVTGALRRSGLPTPAAPEQIHGANPAVGVFLFPGAPAQSGMLEDLCLKMAVNSPAMTCVVQFAGCVGKLKNPPKNRSKSSAQAYLAAMPESVPHVGIAALKRYWDFSSKAVDPLRSFLRQFIR